MFHWHQIWKHMRELTNREVEKRAVMEVIDYFEPKIDAIIKQSTIELKKLNESKGVQGLNKKNRIDQKSIQNAIKHIYGKRHSHLPKKGRKVIKEKKEEIEVT